MEHTDGCGAPVAAPLGSRGSSAGRDAFALAAAVVLAVLFWCVFGLDAVAPGDVVLAPPGVGVVVFVALFMGSAVACLGIVRTKAALRRVPALPWLMAAVVLCAVVPALYVDAGLWLLDALVFFVVGSVAFLLLAGAADDSSGHGAGSAGAAEGVMATVPASVWCRPRGVIAAVGFFARSLVRSWAKAWRMVFAAGRPGDGLALAVRSAVLGVAIGAVLLLASVVLLSSADERFADLVSSALALFGFDGTVSISEAVWRVVRVALVAPMLFSLFHAASHQEGDAVLSRLQGQLAAERPARLGASTAAVALGMLGAACLLFVGVQFSYLFGTQTDAMVLHGGYASYARSGFFELCAAAVLNLATVFGLFELGGSRTQWNRPVRVLAVVIGVSTAVMLVSAIWRLTLYVERYGLSFSRVLALFAIAFVAVCLVAVCVRAVRPQTRCFRAVLTAGIVLWLGFAFMNVNAVVARCNVDGYLSGRIEQIDVGYLMLSSPDALPALDALAQADPDYAEMAASAHESYAADLDFLPWSAWSLSYLNVS